MSDKHDELALGLVKQLELKTGDVVVNRKGYYLAILTDTELASVTTVTEAAGTGETVTGGLTGITLTAGLSFPIAITDFTVTSGNLILFVRE
ncbi:hypothetical protein H8D85_02275 [bacterium]|nr:hypothetical protein [bacterium]